MKTFKGSVSFTTTDLWPKQDDLQQRRDYSYAQSGAKRRICKCVGCLFQFSMCCFFFSPNTLLRRKIVEFGDLGRIVGKETIMVGSVRGELQERLRKYVVPEGFPSSRAPVLPIPLELPASLLPVVTVKDKRDILGSVCGGDMKDDDKVPLEFFERHLSVWKELLHTTFAFGT